MGAKYFEAWENEDLDSVMCFLRPEVSEYVFLWPRRQTLKENRESSRKVFDAYSVEDVKYERTECLVDHSLWLFENRSV